MEELQSTEILDREILEDARKKAIRILKTADDTIAAKNAEWENKTSEAISSINNKYNEQKSLANEKVMARLPVDKLRVKVNKIETLLQNASEDWYKNTDRKIILNLLKNDLKQCLDYNNDLYAENITAYYSGLEQKEAKELLTGINKTFTFIEQDNDTDSSYPQIILETENIRIISSIKNIIDNYLHDKREELVEALVGRAFMEAV